MSASLCPHSMHFGKTLSLPQQLPGPGVVGERVRVSEHLQAPGSRFRHDKHGPATRHRHSGGEAPLCWRRPVPRGTLSRTSTAQRRPRPRQSLA